MFPYSSYTDEQLLSELRDDNEAAFTEIFNRYNKILYSHVFHKLHDKEQAMDIVQDVFIKLWEKRSEIDYENLAGYLFTMARNKVLNTVCHEKVVAQYRSFIRSREIDNAYSPDYGFRQKELAAMIEAEIAALPPRMRETFELRHKQYLSNKEIASKLNLSEHTVADQIKKSLFRLRTKISHSEGM